MDLIRQYDILICVETKTDDFDELELPFEYDYHVKNRKKFKRRSGGIIIIYKKNTGKLLKFHKSESEFVQWLEILCDASKEGNNILVGGIYVPPAYSKYSDDDAFQEIEDELISFSNNKQNIILVGDFNARTADLPDYTVPEENLHAILDIEDHSSSDNEYAYEKLLRLNISLSRHSEDKARPNQYGRKLIELCKRCSLFIANGRIFQDKGIGITTCKDVSVVDYLIMSPESFELVTDFEICDFNPLFSDVHKAIHFTCRFQRQYTLVNIPPKENEIDRDVIKWDQDKANTYYTALIQNNQDHLRDIKNVLNRLQLTDTESVTSEQINGVVNDFCSVLINTAKDIFSTKKVNQFNKTNKNKVWFNNECKTARLEFNRAKNSYRRTKSIANKTLMNKKGKEYRKRLHINYMKFKEKCARELRQLSKNNPKQFWKALNKNSQCKKKTEEIPIETLFQYFKNLNRSPDENNIDDDETIHSGEENDTIFEESNTILNREISEDELKTALRQLKNSKAPGNDKILNEYLKNSPPEIVTMYCKLFNIIFEAGIIPESWTIGVIKPIYKNKGNPNDPDNYRAITLISCLGKLFTRIINNRLNEYSDAIKLISNNQAGFRKKHSTMDNIFIMHALISLYLSSGKKLYCTFVDFRKAFDTVWRKGLWQKINNSGINGKCFKVIYNMYNNIKSCVNLRSETSDFFPCLVGVRQGENMSPFLFSIFLNDLEEFMTSIGSVPLENLSEKIISELHIYIQLFVLLYADDTVIFSETPDGMQRSLNNFQQYCKLWKLEVNVKKTKVMVFSKRKCRQQHSFVLNDQTLDIVDSFTYLGITFKFNGSFVNARRGLIEQAQKSIFSIFRKIRNNAIPVDLQLKLFDSLVEPILLYGSEIWGYEDLKLLEQTHLKFCKRILKVRATTPNYMVYGELGRYPLELNIKLRMLNFWNQLLINEDKLSNILYRLMANLHRNGQMRFKWFDHIKQIFNDIGYTYVFDNEFQMNTSFYKYEIKQRLRDLFIQKWFADTESSSKGQFYLKIKKEFSFESYLTKLSDQNRTLITKLRTSNIKFPIETGRWNNIPREDRLCSLCSQCIGDEFHYIFMCKSEEISNIRTKYLANYFIQSPSIYKFERLMNIGNVNVLKKLALFLKKIIPLI